MFLLDFGFDETYQGRDLVGVAFVQAKTSFDGGIFKNTLGNSIEKQPF